MTVNRNKAQQIYVFFSLHWSRYLQSIVGCGEGLREMMSWLKHRGIKSKGVVICAEHTGAYTNQLIDFTHKKGIALSLNSPLDIKRSMGIARGKNDVVDAARIAEYAYTKREKLRLYEKPGESIMTLQYLLTERRQYMRHVKSKLFFNNFQKSWFRQF